MANAQQPLRQEDAGEHRDLADQQGEAVEGLVKQDQSQSTEKSKERQATRKPKAMTLVAPMVADDCCIEIDRPSLDLALMPTLFGEVPQDHRGGTGMDLLEASEPLLAWERAAVTYDLGSEDRFFGDWTSGLWRERLCGASNSLFALLYLSALPRLHINAFSYLAFRSRARASRRARDSCRRRRFCFRTSTIEERGLS